MTKPTAAERAERKKTEPQIPPNFYAMSDAIQPEHDADKQSQVHSELAQEAGNTRGEVSIDQPIKEEDYMSNVIQGISQYNPQQQDRLLQMELNLLENKRKEVLGQLQQLNAPAFVGGNQDGCSTLSLEGGSRQSLISASQYLQQAVDATDAPRPAPSDHEDYDKKIGTVMKRQAETRRAQQQALLQTYLQFQAANAPEQERQLDHTIKQQPPEKGDLKTPNDDS